MERTFDHGNPTAIIHQGGKGKKREVTFHRLISSKEDDSFESDD